MSANAPILQKILDRLDSIDSRLTNVETRLTTVENEVVKLRSYVHNESYVQERKFTSFLKKYLLQRFKEGIAQVVPFGKFFVPYNNDPLTDIDGCVVLTTPRMQFKRNGRNVIVDMSRIFFIEAKHAITKTILDKKLRQFVKIMESIRIVQDGSYIPQRKEYEFDRMIKTYGVREFPKNIVFLLSTEKLAPDALEIILAITTNSFTKEQYNSLLIQYILTHHVVKDLIDDDHVDSYMHILIQKAASIDDIVNLFNPVQPKPSAGKSQHDLYKKYMSLTPYKESIMSLLVPFESYAALVEPLKGRLGFISNDSIQLPEDIARDGFLNRNPLMNMAYNDVQPYNFVAH